ncbi:MAG: ribosome biogenesis GTPase Der, partial [Thermoplasmata archaeon]|nr:ribosome biogenesis GTPase Der [Thermoplasmata archaeon]
MSPGTPRVAVVGRQNVGKSTLVNRLAGRQEVIAHAMPGVTRDRVELEATWRGRAFRLIDTGGYAHGAGGIEALVSAQAERAATEADLIVLVVDGQTGAAEEDAFLARRLRKATVPVLLVVNKDDTDREEADAASFHRLGLGEPLALSALHGRGTGDLLDRLVALLPAGSHIEVGGQPRFALVGRPNVGKSSLFNRLVGEERSVVFEEAGTTRDSVDAVVRWPSGPVRFVDTAGFRRSAKTHGVEYYSFLRAVRAIDRADVAVLLLDATDPLTTEDIRIAARVMEAGRGLLMVANKWDLVEERDRTFKELTEEVTVFARAQVVRTSARTGSGVPRLPAALVALHARWSS